MRCPLVLFGLLALVSCAGPAPLAPREAAVVEPTASCRIGHDGGPVLAERGFGGTGAPVALRTAERGIGGTGIVGVVTGFASVCVAGVEVRYDRTVGVSADGAPMAPQLLRVGQLVMIDTVAPIAATDSTAEARDIVVRHEVTGPVSAVDPASGVLMVAGQRVVVTSTTWIAGRFAVGTWTSVSGLRQPDGTIVASRLDRAHGDTVSVRGQLVREGDTVRIGRLALQGATVGIVKDGATVSVTGHPVPGGLEVASLAADPLLSDPVSAFGPAARQVVLQAFVRTGDGTVRLSSGQTFRVTTPVPDSGDTYQNAILWLQRDTDGGLNVTGLRYTSYRAQPDEAPQKPARHKPGSLILPPDAPPEPADAAMPSVSGPSDDDAPAAPADVPTSRADPAPPSVQDTLPGRDLVAMDRTAAPIQLAARAH